jgi:hypothetical protein
MNFYIRYHLSELSEKVLHKIFMVKLVNRFSFSEMMAVSDIIENFHAQSRREYYIDRALRHIFYSKVYEWPSKLIRAIGGKIPCLPF